MIELPPWEQAARDADLTLTLPGGVPMFFRLIREGSFLMGARGMDASEEPMHRVVIPRDFYLGTFVVTQEQYRAVAEQCPALREQADPSDFKGPRRPVEQVSWDDAQEWCRWILKHQRELKPLSRGRKKVSIQRLGLPTEAEWEYACRGGLAASDRLPTDYYSGDGEAALADVGWYDGNSGSKTHPVDERSEDHPCGLHGMHGNVWEWCQDVYDPRAYCKRVDGWEAAEWRLVDAGKDAEFWTSEDPKKQSPTRVLRGGSWIFSARFCRSAYRNWYWPVDRGRDCGFRVCLVRGPAAEPGTDRTGAEAEPAPGDGGRGTSPQSDGAGAAGAPAPSIPDLAHATMLRAAGRKKFIK